MVSVSYAKLIDVLRSEVTESFKKNNENIVMMINIRVKKEEAIVLVVTEEKMYFARYNKESENSYIITDQIQISDILSVQTKPSFLKTIVFLQLKSKKVELHLKKQGKELSETLHSKHNIPFQ